jgi:hypothetical protein
MAGIVAARAWAFRNKSNVKNSGAPHRARMQIRTRAFFAVPQERVNGIVG